MWRRNPKVHWNIKGCIPKEIQSIKKHEYFAKNKEKIAEVLCRISSMLYKQWILDNFFSDDAVAWSNRDVVLQKKGQNTIGETRNQWHWNFLDA